MMTRLATITALSLTSMFAGCASDAKDDTTDNSADAISAPETAATTAAVEGTVTLMAPITTTNMVTLSAAFTASFTFNGASCVTIDSDQKTYVNLTFNCPLVATTGTLDLKTASNTSVDATAALTIAGVAITGDYTLDIPADTTAERTLTGSLTIAGPRRELDATADASWTVAGACVTYTASGDIKATGPHGTATASFDVAAKTACR